MTDLKTLQETPPWDWPEDAADALLNILDDRQASADDRLLAADLVGDSPVMNDDLAIALMTIAINPSEPEALRATAAISLGPVLEQSDLDGFDDPEDLPISEKTFRTIQDVLHKLYLDEGNSKELRRRFLEAAVRAPLEWHVQAVRDAYASGDKDWVLTAVFAMSRVPGFEGQILEALESPVPEIHYEAINSAGTRELDAAWAHVVSLVENPSTSKDLLLAAIEAVGNIRPQEAKSILTQLTESPDLEIAETAVEAISMAEALSIDVDEEEPGVEGKWIN